MRNKFKGVTLAATAIAIVAWMFLGYISFIVMASPFSVLAAVRTARQAEQYAEFVANSLKLVDYSELGTAAHARRSLAGEIAGSAGWESRVAIGAARQIGSNPDNLQRIATIDIFQTGDTLSRYTLQVPLSSAGGSYYVKNRSYSTVNLELAYDATTDSIKAYANGVEKPFGDNIGFPDYSKAVLWFGTKNAWNFVHTKKSFTAFSNGWVFCSTLAADYWTDIYVNGKVLFNNAQSGGMDGGQVEATIPLSKGDVLEIDSYYINYLVFVPSKS